MKATMKSMKSPVVLVISFFILSVVGCTDFFSESKSKDKPRSETIQGPPLSGKVLNAIRGGGYTYLHLENDGEQFWVASSVINVKRNDMVRWEGGTVMTNFTSYALNKRFDEIHFVNAVKIVR
jgi:hypothetical protein